MLKIKIYELEKENTDLYRYYTKDNKKLYEGFLFINDNELISNYYGTIDEAYSDLVEYAKKSDIEFDLIPYEIFN